MVTQYWGNNNNTCLMDIFQDNHSEFYWSRDNGDGGGDNWSL